MTYHRTFHDAKENSPFEDYGFHCFCCGEPMSGPTITYDAFPTDDGYLRGVHMHRDCAFAMANRLILDAWPHRRDEADMQTVRS